MLRSIGWPGGRRRLKIDWKSIPDTVFDPSVPINVIEMRRPDTPRRERSRATTVPTFVRASFARIAENWACVYVALRQELDGEAAS